jgi:hypothetical protein
MGALDFHAHLVSLGDTGSQRVFDGPSWYWNPTLTEERTRELEPDLRRHAREFGAQPIEDDGESIFAPSAIDRCTRAAAGDIPLEAGVSYVVAMDPAMSRNSWTCAVAARRLVGGVFDDGRVVGSRLRCSIVAVRQWTGTPAAPLDPFVILKEVREICRTYGARYALTDQHHGSSLAAIGRRPEIGLVVHVVPTTAATKLSGYEDMLTRINDGEMEFPRDPHVRADLLAVRRVPLRTGGLSIQLERIGARHADYAPAIALAVANAHVGPAGDAEPPANSAAWWDRLDRALAAPIRRETPAGTERRGIESDERDARRAQQPKGNRPWWRDNPFGNTPRARGGMPKPPF